MAAAAAAEEALRVDDVPELDQRQRLHPDQDLADLQPLPLAVERKLLADRARELVLRDVAPLDGDAAEEAAHGDRLLVLRQRLFLPAQERVELGLREELLLEHQRAERLAELRLFLDGDDVLQL